MIMTLVSALLARASGAFCISFAAPAAKPPAMTLPESGSQSRAASALLRTPALCSSIRYQGRIRAAATAVSAMARPEMPPTWLPRPGPGSVR